MYMSSGLHQGAECYDKELSLYEEFAYAEDAPGYVTQYIQHRVAHLDIVDAGCSFGKILNSVASVAKSALGVDKSPQAIAAAKSYCEAAGVAAEYRCEDLQSLSIPSKSVDLVYSSWVLGTILNVDARARALAELDRITRSGGSIICIENAAGGEFESIRGRDPQDARTLQYNSWLEINGFRRVTQIETHFEFSSLESAQRIFRDIWGEAAAQRVTTRRIRHPVVIFEKDVAPT
jgi:ubiquinone/menaquinone biosynthesis C-methylase UbiE